MLYNLFKVNNKFYFIFFFILHFNLAFCSLQKQPLVDVSQKKVFIKVSKYSHENTC